MSLGPVDFFAVKFPGNQFRGEIVGQRQETRRHASNDRCGGIRANGSTRSAPVASCGT